MRTLAMFLALAALALGGAGAHAQTTVQLEWVGPAEPNVGTAYNYALNYTISGGGVSDVTVTFDVPPNLAVLGVAPPQVNGVPTLQGGCTQTSPGSGAPDFLPWDDTCTFTATNITPSQGSISGTIAFNLLLRPYGFVNETPIALAATFTSNEASANANLTVLAQATTGVDIWVSDINAYFTYAPGNYDPDGAGPQPLMAGMHYRFPVRWASSGNARLEAGQVSRVPLGPNTWLVGYAPDGGAQANWDIDVDDLTSTAEIGQPGGVLELEHLIPVGTSSGINAVTRAYNTSNHSSRVWVQLFLPCSALAIEPRPPDVPFSYDVTATQAQLAPTLPTELVDTTTVPTGSIATLPYYFDACGSPGTRGKTSLPENQAPLGEDVAWVLDYRPPTETPWSSAMLVDPIPTEVTLVNAALDVSDYIYSTRFAIHFCNVPALAGQTFDLAAFETPTTGYLATGACRPRAEFLNGNVPLANPPWPIAASTHVVGYAGPPGWAEPTGPSSSVEGMLRLRLRVVTHVPLTLPDDHVITNTAALYGTSNGEPRGPLGVSDTVTTNGEADPVVVITTYNASHLSDAVFEPGAPIYFGVSFNRDVGMQVQGPVLDITLPPGVVLDTSNPASWFRDLSNHCGDMPGTSGAPTITWALQAGNPGDPYDDYYTVHIDALNDPQAFSEGCTAPANAAYTRAAFEIPGTVIAMYPHVGSVPNVPSVRLAFNNVSAFDDPGDGLPANQRRDTTSYSVITGLEMRVRQVAGCTDLGPRFVAYDYAMENTAGTHLHGLQLVMTVPKVGSPVGNTVATRFVSVTAPGPGESVWYSTDGSTWTSTPPPADDITHVRFDRAQLDAYTTRTVRVVTEAPGATLGAAVLASSSLDASELLPVPNSDYSAWTAGQCPAKLIVRKYFDALPHGPRGAGDTLLPGWTFDVSDAVGAVGSGTTDGAGETVVSLVPGGYTVTEQVPTGSIVWTSTTGLSRPVTIGLEPTYAVEFGNTCSCDDGNACTTDTCVAPGVCSSTPSAAGAACDPDDLCRVCDAAGACVPKVLDCGDPGACQVGNACDPATGQCSTTPVMCTPLPIYVIVNGPDGKPAGTVKCTLGADGSASCAMNGAYVAIDPTLWCPGE